MSRSALDGTAMGSDRESGHEVAILASDVQKQQTRSLFASQREVTSEAS